MSQTQSETETFFGWVNDLIRGLGRVFTIVVVAGWLTGWEYSVDVNSEFGQWMTLGYIMGAVWVLLIPNTWLRLACFIPMFIGYLQR